MGPSLIVRAGARPGEDPHGRGRLLARRAGEVRPRWCGWGSWDGPGRAVVQICCKGALRPDRSGAEPRNINDSSRASRPDGGLCNRFGQTAPPRARENVRQGASRPGRRPRRALRRANGARGPRRRPPRAPPRRRDVHFALESAVPTVVLEYKTHISRAKCTSRRAQDRPASHYLGRPPPAPPPRTGPGPRTTTPGEKGSLRPSRPEGARGGAARSASTSGSTVSSRGGAGRGIKTTRQPPFSSPDLPPPIRPSPRESQAATLRPARRRMRA